MSRRMRFLFGSKSRITVSGALLLVLLAGVAALAYFLSAGSGTGNATVGSLSAPTINSAIPGAGTVALSWSTVAPPTGSDTVNYYVTRDGGDPTNNCPKASAPTTATSCTDTGLGAGSHSYTVTSVWHSWTTTSATTFVTVTSGALDHFVLSAATTTPTAGQGDNLTITAKDLAGNTVTTYSGSHNLTFGGASTIGSFTPTVTNSSGTAINFGSTTVITFTSGVSSVSGGSNGVMTLYKAETASITVAEGAITNGSGLSVTLAPASAASLVVTAASTTPTAGVTDNLVITARDSFGNQATSYTGDKNLTFSGASSIGSFQPTVTDKTGSTVSFGTATTITFTNGVNTAGGMMTLYKAETVSIVLTDGFINNGSGLSVTVTPAAIDHFTVSGPASTQAGSAFSVTVTAFDQFNNTKTNYIGTVHFAVTSGQATLPANYTFVAGDNGVHTFTNGVTLKTTPSQTITVNDAVTTSATGSATVTVTPAAIDHFMVSAPASAQAGVAFSVTVTAQDVFNNTRTSYTGTVHFTSTDSLAVLPANYTFVAGDNGAHTFPSGVTLKTSGAQTVSVNDTVSTSITGTSGSIAVSGATISASSVLTTGSTVQGSIKNNTGFNVYANVTPAGGTTISSVTANISNLSTTAGSSSVTLTTPNGKTILTPTTGVSATYNYGEATLFTAKNPPTVLTYTVTAVDNLGGTTAATFSVLLDNTAPHASAISAANGGTSGTIDTGDSVTYTYSEGMDPDSIHTTWDGSTFGSLTGTTFQVNISDSGSNDKLVLPNGWNVDDITLGANWVTGGGGTAMVFDATIQQTADRSGIIITLGTRVSAGGTVSIGVPPSTATWTVSSTAPADFSTNIMVKTPASVTGTCAF